MSAGSLSSPGPLSNHRSGPPSGSTFPRQAFAAREPSLMEMMSLSGWRNFVPETLGLLALIAAIRAVFPNGPSGLGSMPHPFWIPVVLMSGQYGIMGGLFATLSATAAFFIGGLPAQSATQDFYDYAGVVAAQPCVWFVTALVLGGLRSLHIHHHTNLQEWFDEAGIAAEDIADGLARAVQEIERLEQRIAVDSSTVTSLLDSLAKLDLSSRRSIVTSIADAILYGVGATSFAVYLAGTSGLTPYFGIEHGSSVAPAMIAPLSPAVMQEIKGPGAVTVPTANGAAAAGRRYWAPICQPGATELIGVVVCNRLQPSQDPTTAVSRLNDVCRVLAVLPLRRSGCSCTAVLSRRTIR